MRFILVLAIPCLALVPLVGFAGEDLISQAEAAGRAGDHVAEKALLEAAVRADPNNAVAKARLVVATQKAAKAVAAERALERVRLPKVELVDASAREAFDYLTQAIARERGEGAKVNLVWMVPEGEVPAVTIRLADIPASAALRLVAESAGLTVSFEPHAIKVFKP